MLHKVFREPLTVVDGPPFNINMFKTYLDMKYQSCGHIGGMGVLDLRVIGPMVLASNIQMFDPRPYDYVEYVFNNIHSYFVNFNDIKCHTFRHYSLLMHMVLYYGQLRGLWHEFLKLKVWEKNGEERSI